jgi:thiamine biosynthesis lipoprotein
MNRREFLHPRRIANVAAPFLGIADELQTPAETSSPAMLRFARRAMATTFECIVPFDTPDAYETAEAALDEIDRLESQLTVYRDVSEVSVLNARAAQQPVRVERNLFDLLTLAKKLHAETDGAFDIAVGALIKSWGFYRRAGRVPTLQELAEVRGRIGMQHVTLDADRQTVFFERPGVEINLGSIGKGFALDGAVNQSALKHGLIHGGHSSILARNSPSFPSAWPVGLTDPERPQWRRAWVYLRNRGMATSAATHQHFLHDGKKLGHVLDPRTAWPAEGILSATVTAPTAAEADALATAFFILGVDKTRAFCETHAEIGAILISVNAPQRLVVLGVAEKEVEILR